MMSREPKISAFTNWINETVLIQNINYDGESDSSAGLLQSNSKCKNVNNNDLALAEETTALVTFGKTKCYGALISESYLVVSDRCVGSVKDTAVFFRYQPSEIDFIMTDVDRGLALIRLVNRRDESICIKTTPAKADAHCISFDSDSIPNFFTVQFCNALEGEPLATIDGNCFSQGYEIHRKKPKNSRSLSQKSKLPFLTLPPATIQ